MIWMCPRSCGKRARCRKPFCHPEPPESAYAVSGESKDPFTRDSPANKGILRRGLASLDLAQNDNTSATLIVHRCLYIHRSNSVDNRVFTLLQTSSNSPT